MINEYGGLKITIYLNYDYLNIWLVKKFNLIPEKSLLAVYMYTA